MDMSLWPHFFGPCCMLCIALNTTVSESHVSWTVSGLLGAAYLQVPIVSVLIDEIFLHDTLRIHLPNHWFLTVLDSKERQKLFETNVTVL